MSFVGWVVFAIYFIGNVAAWYKAKVKDGIYRSALISLAYLATHTM